MDGRPQPRGGPVMANRLDFDLDITLLEDLHTGTGTGDVLIDALQARDSDGYPVIDRHHFRGVLKDNAERLAALGHQWCTDDVQRLFGSGGGAARRLDVSSLRVKDRNPPPERYFITWNSTARRPGSRCPEDHSLRRVEYIKAGTALTGTLRIAPSDDGDQEKIEALLRFTSRLGGGRTRGDGQIQISWTKATAGQEAGQERPWSKDHRLRLVLKAAEPLNIPTTGHAGNLIAGESHIPGRVLFAALCARAADNKELKALFTPKLRVGCAYPLPPSLQTQAEEVQVMPMPAHLHRVKPSAASQERDLCWPHWAENPADDAPPLREGVDVDVFDYQGNAKLSRPKGHLYLVRDDQGVWRQYRQPMEVRMRNRRGKFDGALKREDTELFTEQRIPAGTCLVADIQCEDETLKAWLAKHLQPGRTVRVGRGKAPVRVEAVHAAPDRPEESQEGVLTIVATSDWIIRGDNLAPLTALDKTGLLKHALGLDETQYPDLVLDARQETETQGSFNYATGLPRLPFAVIRRGSVFRLAGKQAQIDDLRGQLKTHPPLGERTSEGYGGFILDPPIGFQPREDETAPPPTGETPDAATREPGMAQSPPVEPPTGESPPPQEPEGGESPPAESQDAGCPQAGEMAGAYFRQLRQNAKSEPPDRETWAGLKAALLGAAVEKTFVLAAADYGDKCTYLLRDQKANNLGRYLADKFRGERNSNCLPAFLDELERLIYAGEDA